jgi:hypothetical protein
MHEGGCKQLQVWYAVGGSKLTACVCKLGLKLSFLIGTRETDAREKEKGQLSSGITSKTCNLLPPGLAFSQSQNGITR